MVRRIRRSTVVFVEAVLAVAAAGIAAGAVLHNALGYALAGVAVLVGVAGVVRFGGRGLVDLAVDRLHDRPDPEDQLGLSRLVPQLHVAEVRTRDGGGIGVAGDGQGFVVALDAGSTAPPGWALSDLVAILVDDPARPAAVQVLVEQHALGENADPRFGPGRTYRSLAVDGIPLWNRVLLVIRHEPAWAPETVETRGGGATGARNALAAVAGRTVARARQDRIRLRPLGAAELTAVLRDLGPPPDAASDTVADGAPADDIVVSVPLARDDALGALLPELAALDVARSVVSVTASAVDHSLWAVARLTDPRPAVAAEAAAELVADGLVTVAAGSAGRGRPRDVAAGWWRALARGRGGGAPMTTTDRLPAVRWREPRDVTAVLDIPPAGVLLGTDPEGAPVVLPAVGPRVTRLGVVGDRRIAGLIAYRLLGVGCLLRIATAAPDRWRHLAGVAGGRASVGPSAAGWPPPHAAGGPPLLLSDLDAAPDHLARNDRPGTVVHVVNSVPPGGAYWSAVDAVVVTGPGHGSALARLLGRDDARALDRIGRAQLGLLDHHRAVTVTPVLAAGE